MPLGKIIAFSLRPTDIGANRAVVNWNIAGRAIGFTFYQAFLSTVFTLLFGLPLAFLFGRFRFRGRKLFRILATLPFILPTVVVAAAFNALIGPNGWFNFLLMRTLSLSAPPINLLNSLPAIIIAHIFYNISIVIRTVGTAWEQLDRKVENSARMLGASPWQVFFKITAPLLLPSILSALVLVFLFDFTSFGVILLMGGARFTTIEVEIYIQTMQFLNLRIAAVLALIQIAFSMFLTGLSARINKFGAHTRIPVMADENLRKPHNGPEKWFLVFALLLLILLFILPLAALLLRAFSFESAEIPGLRFTFAHFLGLFKNERRSLFFVPPVIGLRNSLLYAAIAMFISVGLGLIITFQSREEYTFGKIIQALIMLPLGTSAVTLGLGYLGVFSVSPRSVRWFPLLIPILHALIALPFVIRIIQPAVEAIPKELYQAAITLGVPQEDLWKRITLPLVRKQISASAVFAFAISLGEFGATSFLARPEYPTLSVAIFRYLSLPGVQNFGRAMAMAAILLIICGIGFLLIEKYDMDTLEGIG